MSPSITVLMSVYNGEKYLKDAIESILNQTYKNFEFLIIDDCSNDNSLEIINEFKKLNSQIKLITNKENIGLGSSLKKGVNLAKGQWIARMDADDIAMPERLETQIEFAKKNPQIDIIGSWAIDIDNENNEIDKRQVPLSHEQICKYIWTCPIIHPTVLFKKSSILKVNSYGKEKRRQDYALWFRAAAYGLKFANIDQYLLKYRYDDEYFSKNNLKALIDQAKIGLKGCKSVKAPPLAYIGVTIPLVKGILPGFIKKPASKILKKFDPRNQNT